MPPLRRGLYSISSKCRQQYRYELANANQAYGMGKFKRSREGEIRAKRKPALSSWPPISCLRFVCSLDGVGGSYAIQNPTTLENPIFYGRGGRARTRNQRFWRPLWGLCIVWRSLGRLDFPCVVRCFQGINGLILPPFFDVCSQNAPKPAPNAPNQRRLFRLLPQGISLPPILPCSQSPLPKGSWRKGFAAAKNA
ncbi:hypothetical protein MOOTH_01930 [Moorella thermoacetica]|nr:hypothetical protein MOOTH_01930 [Moorella thermoacetica]